MLSSGSEASSIAAGIVPSTRPLRSIVEARLVDAAAIAPQHEHVQRQCGDEQMGPERIAGRGRSETGMAMQPEAEADRALQDRRDRHDAR